jgi:hypothetical protein
LLSLLPISGSQVGSAYSFTTFRIDVIVATARSRQDFTHFISLPVNSPELQAAFLQFKAQVKDFCSELSIIFIA